MKVFLPYMGLIFFPIIPYYTQVDNWGFLFLQHFHLQKKYFEKIMSYF